MEQYCWKTTKLVGKIFTCSPANYASSKTTKYKSGFQTEIFQILIAQQLQQEKHKGLDSTKVFYYSRHHNIINNNNNKGRKCTHSVPYDTQRREQLQSNL
jgi:hypothetical protein